MSERRRGELPDNLDPLVDTLSNVVGILVIVIALTQLEISDALARVARRASESRAVAVEPAAAQAGEGSRTRSDPQAAVEGENELRARARAERRDRLLLRAGESDLEQAARRVESRIKRLDSAPVAAIDPEQLGRALAAERVAYQSERAADRHRRAYARDLVEVPEALVARLPDPQTFVGREAWMLVRYGRVYPVDREALFEKGRQAITRIIPDGGTRALRPDELEAAALYLRKHDAGLGSVRWELETEPALRAVLKWRTRDGGIERNRLADDPTLAAWLSDRDPASEMIRFHVWTDSFETYLEARKHVEAAGFRADWEGHERDRDLSTGLRFGPRLPEVRPRAVD